MSEKLTEKQRRIVASYVKSIPYAPPEDYAERAEDLADGLVDNERRRIAGELESVIRDGRAEDWRSRLLAIATKLSRGEP